MKRYTIKFRTNRQKWVVIDTQDPDANLGYHYDKADAQRVADMLNQRIELLAALEQVNEIASNTAGPGCFDLSCIADKAIAKAKGGE